MAGDGDLRDGSTCSNELRTYLAQADLPHLASYVDRCLTNPFPKSGQVLQDLVNELGRRLDYDVNNGRYAGVAGQIGHDGLWTDPNGHSLIVEVKTTDVYRISLETLANYRTRLLAGGQISAQSSGLLVVGRQETGELEAQIRGSKHAWDMRLISIEALLKLTQLKQETDDPETAEKIRTILTPFEYTKLDRLVDVMFATARDASSTPEIADAAAEAETSAEQSAQGHALGFTEPQELEKKRGEIISALSSHLKEPFVKKSKALVWNATHTLRAACTISKRYVKPGQVPYWYAFHPKWKKFFEEGEKAFLVLGCMDLDHAYAIPSHILFPLLPHMGVTESTDRLYWHIKLEGGPAHDLSLQLPRIGQSLELTPFRFSLLGAPSA